MRSEGIRFFPRRTILERGIFGGSKRELLEDVVSRSAVSRKGGSDSNIGEVLHGGREVVSEFSKSLNVTMTAALW